MDNTFTTEQFGIIQKYGTHKQVRFIRSCSGSQDTQTHTQISELCSPSLRLTLFRCFVSQILENEHLWLTSMFDEDGKDHHLEEDRSASSEFQLC